MLVAVALLYGSVHRKKELPNGYYTLEKVQPYAGIGQFLLFILGLVEVYGGIASWCGLGIWNVPFPNIELFQVSMAFADLLSAVFLFYLAIYGD